MLWLRLFNFKKKKSERVSNVICMEYWTRCENWGMFSRANVCKRPQNLHCMYREFWCDFARTSSVEHASVFFGFPGDVLGVAQLCNKKTGQHFTEFDEDLASAFAVYCCISISHVSASLIIPFNLIHFKSFYQRSMYKFTFYL